MRRWRGTRAWTISPTSNATGATTCRCWPVARREWDSVSLLPRSGDDHRSGRLADAAGWFLRHRDAVERIRGERELGTYDGVAVGGRLERAGADARGLADDPELIRATLARSGGEKARTSSGDCCSGPRRFARREGERRPRRG